MIKDILYFHIAQKDNPTRRLDYFDYVLEINKLSNSCATHHLIGNYQCCHLDVTTSPQEILSKNATSLMETYFHLSKNPYEFEINCILRWFYILEYVRSKQINHFVYLDSDNILLESVDDLPEDITITYARDDLLTSISFVCPNIFVINDPSLLSDFVGITLDYYRNRLHDLKATHRALQESAGCGISDMFFWGEVYRKRKAEFRSTKAITDKLFCVAIETAQGYEMENGMKKLFMQENGVFVKNMHDGSMVPVASLHFHALHKKKIKHFHHQWMLQYFHKKTKRPLPFIKIIIYSLFAAVIVFKNTFRHYLSVRASSH